MEMEFNCVLTKQHKQLRGLVTAIAGAFIMHHLPLRVLVQVLHDLVLHEEVRMAIGLYDATKTTASITKLGAATMRVAANKLREMRVALKRKRP
jgi:hypothetical protein